MQVKLTKKMDNLEVGSIIEVKDELDILKLTKDGHILYTEDIKAAEEVIHQKKIEDFKQTLKEEFKMEVKKEINVLVKKEHENRCDTVKDIASALMTGKVKEVKIDTKAPAGMNEDTADTDGGFLVSHDISNEIYGRLFEGNKIWDKVRKVEIGNNYNGMKLPYLNIATQSTTSQPRLYNLAEAAQKTPTKFTFGQHDLALVKNIALVPITDELLQDKTQLEAYVMSQLKGQFGWKQDYNVLMGTAATTGNIGIFDATGAAFGVTPVAHAATPTVTIVNSLISGVAPQVRDGAEWFMSADMWAYVMAAMGPGVANVLIPIAKEEGAVRTLQGYPVNLIDGMVAHNTAKDMLFMNPKEIIALEKGGITVDISKEFYFDTDQMALRFVYRQASAPVYASYQALDGKSYSAISFTS